MESAGGTINPNTLKLRPSLVYFNAVKSSAHGASSLLLFCAGSFSYADKQYYQSFLTNKSWVAPNGW
jgi:hypothetical protein